MRFPAAHLSILSLILRCAQCSSLLTVTLPAGKIQGAQCDNVGTSAFLSIPFAQPPVNQLRFAPPEPFEGSYAGGALDAKTPAPSCIQFGTQYLADGPTSEDW